MRINPLSDQKLSASRRNTYLLMKTVALFFLGWLLVSTPVRADSVMALPGGGENIMVTFDEDELGSATFPLTYRGVTYTRVEGAGLLIWTVPTMPITRFVKSPMLAMTVADESPGDPANPISLRLDFEQPSRFFGFGLGFNDRTQTPDGSLLPHIGSVVLEFSNGRSQAFPLSASRVVCCTEARFDYSDTDDGIVGNGLVESATITLNYNYDPFFPGSGFPGEPFSLKFMGIDDVSYSTAIVPTSMEVAIDINPGKNPNIINLKSGGFVNVAVLTEGDFDALQVDPDTTKFGPDHAVIARYRVKDVDSDGDDDLLLYYRILQTEIACSDTQATLTGELYDETPITGTDSVQTKNCQ
jgi:hypothetical protein